jgi:uncharacterized membrane protein YphA (DoxX/SURF4 family)
MNAEPVHKDAGPRGPGPGDPLGTAPLLRRVPPLLQHGARWFLGGVFLYASYDKILHPQAFAQAIFNYQILPDAAVNLTALVLPWLESLLGLCLLVGFWLPGATALSTLMLTVFLGALAFNQWRGLDVYCGCFSTQGPAGTADLGTLARDIGFLLLSAVVTAAAFSRRGTGPPPVRASRGSADKPG